MSASGYESYRESGIEWLGEIPSHWHVKPIKAVASYNDDVLTEATPPDHEIDYVEISDVQAGLGIRGSTTYAFSDAPSRARRRVQDGDIIVSTVRTYLRAIAAITAPAENTVVSTGFAVIRPRAIYSRFIGYALLAEQTINQIIARSVGVSYPAINASDLVRIPVSVPPPAEQAVIAAFLDRETGKIDALVEAQTRLIELLKEKRQAVISHAVTKGLDPAAPMKDSGVEWLGQVPAHWKVGPLRACLSQRSEKNENAANQNYLSLVAGRGVIPYADKGDMGNKKPEDLSRCKIVREGDIVINSMNFGIGSFGRSIYSGVCSAVYVVLYEADGSVDLDFAASIFATRSFQTYAQSFGNGILAHRSAIGWDELKALQVGVPPIEEQHEILARLRAFDDYSLRLTSKVQSAIALLQERRSALISAAVTGKIDVRGLRPEQAEAA